MWEVFLTMTEDCNLKCGYCYESSRNRANDEIRLHSCQYGIRELVNFLAKLAELNDSIALVFYGGEPTLQPEKLLDWSTHIKRKIPFVTQTLHTNGLLLDQMPEQLFSNVDSIFLSVNMEDDLVYSNRDYYIKTVRENIDFLKKVREIPIILRLTYTKKAHFLQTCFLFEDVVDGIYWQIDSRNISSPDLLNSYYSDLSLLLIRWFSSLDRSYLPKYLPLDYALIKAINKEDFEDKIMPCGFGERLIFIDLDGSIYACPELMQDGESRIGSITDKLSMESTRQLIDLVRCNCNGCDAVNFCRGRCPAMHKKHDFSAFQLYCDLTRQIFDDFKKKKALLTDETLRDIRAKITSPRILTLMNLVERIH